MSPRFLFTFAVLAIAGAIIWATDSHRTLIELLAHRKPKAETVAAVAPPSVTVARVKPADFVETVLVTGSLVPREDVLVAPEVEGLRIIDIKADEGDVVKKGEVLAVLETVTLDAQLAQNNADLERSIAAISQAKNQITDVEARLAEAKAQLERAKPLEKSGYLSGSVLDQRQAAASSLAALLQSARNGLAAAEADKVRIEAQRRELEWRRSRTEIRAPVDGLISRRSAHIGAIATAVGLAAGEPMFRIIQDGEIELDAEVGEADVGKVHEGQSATITIADGLNVSGKVRLVSPVVDRATRLHRADDLAVREVHREPDPALVQVRAPFRARGRDPHHRAARHVLQRDHPDVAEAVRPDALERVVGPNPLLDERLVLELLRERAEDGVGEVLAERGSIDLAPAGAPPPPRTEALADHEDPVSPAAVRRLDDELRAVFERVECRVDREEAEALGDRLRDRHSLLAEHALGEQLVVGIDVRRARVVRVHEREVAPVDPDDLVAPVDEPRDLGEKPPHAAPPARESAGRKRRYSETRIPTQRPRYTSAATTSSSTSGKPMTRTCSASELITA